MPGNELTSSIGNETEWAGGSSYFLFSGGFMIGAIGGALSRVDSIDRMLSGLGGSNNSNGEIGQKGFVSKEDLDKEHQEAIQEQRHLTLMNMQQMRVAAQCTFMKTCAQSIKDAAGRQ